MNIVVRFNTISMNAIIKVILKIEFDNDSGDELSDLESEIPAATDIAQALATVCVERDLQPWSKETDAHGMKMQCTSLTYLSYNCTVT